MSGKVAKLAGGEQVAEFFRKMLAITSTYYVDSKQAEIEEAVRYWIKAAS